MGAGRLNALANTGGYEMITSLVSGIMQIIVVLIVAAGFWLAFGRSKVRFASWIGLIAPPAGALRIALAATLALLVFKLPLLLWPAWLDTVTGGGTVIGSLSDMRLGVDAIGSLLVIAFLKTALSEELLFRGLIAKRLYGFIGFRAGNIIQAALFGAVHLFIFALPDGPPFQLGLAFVFFALPSMSGWVIGYVNEKYGGGSIAPGWLMHGAGNALWYYLLAFGI